MKICYDSMQDIQLYDMGLKAIHTRIDMMCLIHIDEMMQNM